MNSRFTLALALVFAASIEAATQSQGISTPAARLAALKTVETLLAGKVKQGEDTVLVKDPFNPSAQDLREDYDPNAAKDQRPLGRRPEAELLEEMAKQVQPTGSVTLGGEPYLLFGEKRRKMGDKVTVLIDGVEYEIEIGTIEKNRFRILYNDLQTTRSIR
jgi:hypothetical protein